ncbi:hypothetical protein ASF61_03880 [Duganella sp. Leaf126]|uniref:DUF4153 domain-containing protein n=1 Tax=Duganella sp. Leaf126 TaxID=1736266 RepID=UPI0006FE7327|nr:DUF4153 domain-containing protein [Duganella sp. Leaf126]KQQ39962.1 hypothetical protein ASF61_03880 [Duganella sp. Leaf126]
MQIEHYDEVPGAQVSRPVMTLRLATGLVQGVLLYLLYRAATIAIWPATEPFVFLPLFLLVLLLPVVFIASLGHMTSRNVARWTAAAGAVLLIMALHEAWRSAGAVDLGGGFMAQLAERVPTMQVIVFSGVFLYIAHTLVMAGVGDGKRIASYGSYFEISWKLAVQLLFSAFFVGALWLVLWMGAGLFSMVKLGFLERLLGKPWFVAPVICFAFSCALHITDVRPAIVRGIRSLLLVLASWILPVAVVLIGGFLCTLPFTGLDGLWKTRSATALLLTTVAVLVLLINCAFQNGQTAATLAIRIAARMAAILLLPLTGIAIYALGLRVHEYGWTVDRIVAAACLLVASCYALGYQWAAHRYETWLVEIAPVNVGTACVALVVLLALFTPLADPARLAVASQVGRLERGLVKADKFDYHFLRFEGQRYGQQALQQLARQGVGPQPALVAAGAAAALKRTNRWSTDSGPATAATIAANITVVPAGDALPASFIGQQWKKGNDQPLPDCLKDAAQRCTALLLDADGDGRRDVLLQPYGYGESYLYQQQPDGRWVASARIASFCQPALERLRAGRYKLVQPPMKAIDVDGMLLLFQPVFSTGDCRALKSAPAASEGR